MANISSEFFAPENLFSLDYQHDNNTYTSNMLKKTVKWNHSFISNKHLLQPMLICSFSSSKFYGSVNSTWSTCTSIELDNIGNITFISMHAGIGIIYRGRG